MRTRCGSASALNSAAVAALWSSDSVAARSGAQQPAGSAAIRSPPHLSTSIDVPRHSATRIDVHQCLHPSPIRRNGDVEIWTRSRIADKVASVSREPSDVLLRRHGLNVTTQRLGVLRALSERPHSTAEDIYKAVRAEIGALSRQAVYDALTAFTGKGILRRIQPAGSPARYEHRVGDNHHHLVCRHCSRMVDVDCAVGETPCLTAADDSGYEIDEAEVVYWGHCSDCAAAIF
ncbi:MAG: hypothetical protein GEU74_12915 [Nitriliruptorales bacterium]|nr:hypothetical protein [Nitriliruptorales bacterium]